MRTRFVSSSAQLCVRANGKAARFFTRNESASAGAKVLVNIYLGACLIAAGIPAKQAEEAVASMREQGVPLNISYNV